MQWQDQFVALGDGGVDEQAEAFDRGGAIASPLKAGRMAQIAAALWDDEPARAALAQRAAGLALADGVEVAVRALGELIEPKPFRN